MNERVTEQANLVRGERVVGGTHANEGLDQAARDARIEVENEMTLPGIAMLALVNIGQRQTRVVIYIDMILHGHQRRGIWELDPTGSRSVNSYVETNQLSVDFAKQEVSDVNDV